MNNSEAANYHSGNCQFLPQVRSKSKVVVPKNTQKQKRKDKKEHEVFPESCHLAKGCATRPELNASWRCLGEDRDLCLSQMHACR